MEEALHPAFAFSRLETLLFKESHEGLMNFFGGDAGPHHFEGELLALKDSVIEFANRLRGAAADDGAGDVAEITCLLRARKNVEDDRFMGAKRAMAGFVRIAGLLAAGDDGMGGRAACLEDGSVNDRTQFFGGERDIMVEEAPAFAYLGRAQHLDGFGHADLSHRQRGADVADFLGRFLLALRKEIAQPGPDPNAGAAQAGYQAVGKVSRHNQTLDPLLAQNGRRDLGEAWAPDTSLAEFGLVAGEGERPAMRCLRPGAIDFEVAEDDVASAAQLQVNERIGHEHADSVE